MDWDLVIKLLQNFGFPVVCIMTLSWALWKSVTWLGNNILKPVVDAHLTLIQDLRRTLVLLDEGVRSITENQTSISTQQTKLAVHQDSLAISLKQLADSDPFKNMSKKS